MGNTQYLCFLEVTKPDLLKNFKVSGSSVSGIMDVLRVGFGFALIFSYPIVVWEARHMLQQEFREYESALILSANYIQSHAKSMSA